MVYCVSIGQTSGKKSTIFYLLLFDLYTHESFTSVVANKLDTKSHKTESESHTTQWLARTDSHTNTKFKS